MTIVYLHVLLFLFLVSLNTMKALWLISYALLLRYLETSAQGSENSTCQDDHQMHFVDERCDGMLKRNGLWDARCHLNGSLKTLAPMVLFESL